METIQNPGSNVTFDQEDIVNAINEISRTAAAGPDRFPAVLLKHCRNALARPLYLIWRKSLDCGIIHKTANIVPIHKGKSRGVLQITEWHLTSDQTV